MSASPLSVPPRKSSYGPIGITLLAGALLPGGSCYGFLGTMNSNSYFQFPLLAALGFFFGVVLFLIGFIGSIVWAINGSAPMSLPPQPEQSVRPGFRRILLTILGGISLTFCSYVAFFSFPGSGVVEYVAAFTYTALFLAGIVLFFGGCIQAVGFLYRRFRGIS